MPVIGLIPTQVLEATSRSQVREMYVWSFWPGLGFGAQRLGFRGCSGFLWGQVSR